MSAPSRERRGKRPIGGTRGSGAYGRGVSRLKLQFESPEQTEKSPRQELPQSPQTGTVAQRLQTYESLSSPVSQTQRPFRGSPRARGPRRGPLFPPSSSPSAEMTSPGDVFESTGQQQVGIRRPREYSPSERAGRQTQRRRLAFSSSSSSRAGVESPEDIFERSAQSLLSTGSLEEGRQSFEGSSPQAMGSQRQRRFSPTDNPFVSQRRQQFQSMSPQSTGIRSPPSGPSRAYSTPTRGYGTPTRGYGTPGRGFATPPQAGYSTPSVGYGSGRTLIPESDNNILQESGFRVCEEEGDNAILGEGVSGRVFKGACSQGARKTVDDGIQSREIDLEGKGCAIKQLLSRSPQQRRYQLRQVQQDRTEESAQTLVRANHPNVLDFYSVVRTPSNTYIVTELVLGTTLNVFVSQHRRQESEDRRLPEEVTMDIFRQMAQGIHYLHSIGLVHNDLHGHNVMLTPRPNGSGFVVKIVDFGKCLRLRADNYMYDIEQLGDLLRDLKSITNFQSPLIRDRIDRLIVELERGDYRDSQRVIEEINRILPSGPPRRLRRSHSLPTDLSSYGRIRSTRRRRHSF